MILLARGWRGRRTIGEMGFGLGIIIRIGRLRIGWDGFLRVIVLGGTGGWMEMTDTPEDPLGIGQIELIPRIPDGGDGWGG